MSGYRGQTFKQRASALPFADWQSTKELLTEMGNAIDELQTDRIAETGTEAGGDPTKTSLQEGD